jgi:outer membrane protein assembly factor BamA
VLKGNRAFDGETLRRVARTIDCEGSRPQIADLMAAVEGAPAGPCGGANDVAKEIEFFYFDRGYPLTKVRATGPDRAGRLHVTVDEGSLFHLGAIEVVENDPRPADPAIGDPRKLAGSVALRQGEPWVRHRLRAEADRLEERYVRVGYREVIVMPVTEIASLDPPVIDVRFEIERGEKGPVAR